MACMLSTWRAISLNRMNQTLRLHVSVAQQLDKTTAEAYLSGVLVQRRSRCDVICQVRARRLQVRVQYSQQYLQQRRAPVSQGKEETRLSHTIFNFNHGKDDAFSGAHLHLMGAFKIWKLRQSKYSFRAFLLEPFQVTDEQEERR